MGNCAGLATRRVIIQPGGARGPHTAPGAPIPCRSGALGGCGVRLARELARAKHQSSRREHSKCPPSTPLTKADHQARLGFATQRSGSYRTALSLLAVKLNVLMQVHAKASRWRASGASTHPMHRRDSESATERARPPESRKPTEGMFCCEEMEASSSRCNVILIIARHSPG